MASVHLVAGRDGWAGRSRRPASAGQQGRDQAGLGSWLREAREARGLTIDDIARETKIPLRHLESLEHGCLDVVPAFYQRAEVRAVARAVGVDEGLAVGRLECAARPVVEPMVEPAPSTTPPSDLRVRLSWTLTLAGGTLVLGALLWMAARIDYALPGLPKRSPGLGAVSSKVTATQPEPVAAPVSTAPVTTAPVTTAPVGAARTSASAVAATEDDVPVPSVTEPPVTGPSVIGPSVTELVIRTEPPGAQVTVNGVGWGVSPVTIRHLSPGGKRIRVTREGFAATERALTLDEGQRRTMDLRLRTVE